MTELFDILHTYKEDLVSPLEILESEGEKTILDFNQIVQPGDYELTVNLSAQFMSIEDRFRYRLINDYVTEVFEVTSQATTDNPTFSFSVPYTQGILGTFNVTLRGQISGYPAVKVDIGMANILLRRIGL